MKDETILYFAGFVKKKKCKNIFIIIVCFTGLDLQSNLN